MMTKLEETNQIQKQKRMTIEWQLLLLSIILLDINEHYLLNALSIIHRERDE